MRKWLSMGVVVASLASLSWVVLPSAHAEKKENKKEEPAKVDPEQAKNSKAAEEGSRSVEAIGVAHTLIFLGRSGKETDADAVKLTRAEALVLAARILKQNPLETLKDLPEGVTKAEPIDDDKVIDGLLKEARVLGQGDKNLAVQIDRVKEAVRGSVGGAYKWSGSVALNKTVTFTRTYKPGTPVTLTLAYNPVREYYGNNLALWIMNSGKSVTPVYSGRGPGNVMSVTYNVPTGTSPVTLSIVIQSSGWNDPTVPFTLTTN